MEQRIAEKAKLVKWNEPDIVLDFFTQNSTYFENYANLSDEQSIIEIIELKLRYVSSLTQKKYHYKARKIVSRLKFLNNKIDHLDSIFKENQKKIKFHDAILTGNAGKWKEALSILN